MIFLSLLMSRFYIATSKLDIIRDSNYADYKFAGYYSLFALFDLKKDPDLFPQPNIYIPRAFSVHITDVLQGRFFGYTYDPSNFFYRLGASFYLHFLWFLGGGRRLFPVFNVSSPISCYGFYDLRWTPLSAIFGTIYYLKWTLGNLPVGSDLWFYNRSGLFWYYFGNLEVLDWQEGRKRLAFNIVFSYLFFIICISPVKFISFLVFNTFFRPIIYLVLQLWFLFTFFVDDYFVRPNIVGQYRYLLFFYDSIIYFIFLYNYTYSYTSKYPERIDRKDIRDYDRLFHGEAFFVCVKEFYAITAFIQPVFSRHQSELFIHTIRPYWFKYFTRIGGFTRLMVLQRNSNSYTTEKYHSARSSQVFFFRSLVGKKCDLGAYSSSLKSAARQNDVGNYFFQRFVDDVKNLVQEGDFYFQTDRVPYSLAEKLYARGYFFLDHSNTILRQLFQIVKFCTTIVFRSTLFMIFFSLRWFFAVSPGHPLGAFSALAAAKLIVSIFGRFKIFFWASIFPLRFFSSFIFNVAVQLTRSTTRFLSYSAESDYINFFKRLYFSAAFIRFFSREIDEDVEQFKNFYSYQNEFDDSSFDSSMFEFSSWDNIDEFFHDKAIYKRLDVDDYFLNSARGTGNFSVFNFDDSDNLIFEQLLLGWVGTHFYGIKSAFYFVKNYSFKQPKYLVDYSHFADYEDDEELFADPDYFTAPTGRYYNFVLHDHERDVAFKGLFEHKLRIEKWYKRASSKNFIKVPAPYLISAYSVREPKGANEFLMLTRLVSRTFFADAAFTYSGRFAVDPVVASGVWNKFSELLKSDPDYVYRKISALDFERIYSRLETDHAFYKPKPKFSVFVPSFFLNFLSNFYSKFSGYIRFVRAIFVYDPTTFEGPNEFYYSYNYLSKEVVKSDFNRLSYEDSLLFFSYCQYLAELDFSRFYNFVNCLPNSLITNFSVAMQKFVEHRRAQSFEFVVDNPESGFDWWLEQFRFSQIIEWGNDDLITQYSKNYSFERLILFQLTGFFFYSSVRGVVGAYLDFLKVPEVTKPLEFVSEAETSSEIFPWYLFYFRAESAGFFSSFYDLTYSYFLDPCLNATFFPAHFTYFIEDVYEHSEEDYLLDINDEYIGNIAITGLFDAVQYFVNEAELNDDEQGESETFDPSELEDQGRYSGDHFDTDDTTVPGDIPYFDDNFEMYISDNLDSDVEEWEPDEYDSFGDLAIPLDRLFFGFLRKTNDRIPASDPRIFNDAFNTWNESSAKFVVGNSFEDQQISSFKDNLSLVPLVRPVSASRVSFIRHFYLKLFKAAFFGYATFTNFFYRYTIYFFYSDISYIAKSLILRHYSKFFGGYSAFNSTSKRVNTWVLDFEMYQRFGFTRLKKFYSERFYFNPFPKGKPDVPYFNFIRFTPFSSFPYWHSATDTETELEFISSLSSDTEGGGSIFFSDQDGIFIRRELDLFLNSRFNKIDELEEFYFDKLTNDSSSLDYLISEEQDWDAGSLISLSVIDYSAEADYYIGKTDILLSACLDVLSAVSDYMLYAARSKFFNTFVLPQLFWHTYSEVFWHKLASRIGYWIYVFRQLGGLTIVAVLIIYFFFVFPRVFFIFFSSLNYAWFSFFLSFSSFFFLFFLFSAFIFPLVSYYKSLEAEERREVVWLVFFVWLFHIFFGYTRTAWTSIADASGSERFINIGTEPNLFFLSVSRQIDIDLNSDLEAARKFIIYDISQPREILVHPKKAAAVEPSKRIVSSGLDFRRSLFSPLHAYKAFTTYFLGFYNSYFTGYKYYKRRASESTVRDLRNRAYNNVHRQYKLNLGGFRGVYGRSIKKQVTDILATALRYKPAYDYKKFRSEARPALERNAPSYFVAPFINSYRTPWVSFPYDFRTLSFRSGTHSAYDYYSTDVNRSIILTNFNEKFYAPSKKLKLFKTYRKRRNVKNFIRSNRAYRRSRNLSFRNAYHNLNSAGSQFYVSAVSSFVNQTKIQHNYRKNVYANQLAKYLSSYNFRKSYSLADVGVRADAFLPRGVMFRKTQILPDKAHKGFEFLPHNLNEYYTFNVRRDRNPRLHNIIRKVQMEEIMKWLIEKRINFLLREEGFFRSYYTQIHRGLVINLARRFRFLNHSHREARITKFNADHYYFNSSVIRSLSSVNSTLLTRYIPGILADSTLSRSAHNPFYYKSRFKRKHFYVDTLDFSKLELGSRPFMYDGFMRGFKPKKLFLNRKLRAAYFRGRYGMKKFYSLPRRIRKYRIRNSVAYRYSSFFNNRRIYKYNFRNYRSFNRVTNPVHTGLKRLKEHESKLRSIAFSLPGKNSTMFSHRFFDAPTAYNESFDFSNNYGPRYDYFRFSPYNYSYTQRRFKAFAYAMRTQKPRLLTYFAGTSVRSRRGNYYLQLVELKRRQALANRIFNFVTFKFLKTRRYMPYYSYFARNGSRNRSKILSSELRFYPTERVLRRYFLKHIIRIPRRVKYSHAALSKLRLSKKKAYLLALHSRRKRPVKYRIVAGQQPLSQDKRFHSSDFRDFRKAIKRNLSYYRKISSAYEIRVHETMKKLSQRSSQPRSYFRRSFYIPEYDEKLGKAQIALAQEKRRRMVQRRQKAQSLKKNRERKNLLTWNLPPFVTTKLIIIKVIRTSCMLLFFFDNEKEAPRMRFKPAINFVNCRFTVGLTSKETSIIVTKLDVVQSYLFKLANLFYWRNFVNNFGKSGPLGHKIKVGTAGLVIAPSAQPLLPYISGFNYLVDFHFTAVGLLLCVLVVYLYSLIFVGSFSHYKIGGKNFFGLLNYRNFSFFIFIALSELALLVCFSVNDFFVFYMFFEFILIPFYFIVGIWGSRLSRIGAAFRLVFFTVFFSLPLIVIIFSNLFSNLFSFNFSILFSTLNSMPPVFQVFFLLSCFFAFAVKIPLFPIHVWLPEAHGEAPTFGSILLAGVLLKLGGYGFFRIFFENSDVIEISLSHAFFPFIYLISTITIIFSNIAVFNQVDIKRTIAYYSIGHIGFVTLGFITLSYEGYVGACVIMLAHGLSAAGLFFSVGYIYERSHTRSIMAYRGLATILPYFATFFFFFICANASLPGTLNFIGEQLVLFSLVKFHPAAAVLPLVGVFINGLSSFLFLLRIAFGEVNRNCVGIPDFSPKLSFTAFMMIWPLVLFGFFPDLIIQIL